MNAKKSKQLTYWLGVVAVGLAVGLSVQFVIAWTEPSSGPPGGNVGAPVNTSNIGQTKYADLSIQTANNTYGLVHLNSNPTTSILKTWIEANFAQIGTATASPLGFFTNNSTAQMTLLTNGNVGIGTTDPHNLLELSGPDPHIRIGFSGAPTGEGDYSALEFSDDAGMMTTRLMYARLTENMELDYNNDNDAVGNFVIKNYETPIMTINNAGNVGIGTTNPEDKLHVVSGADNGVIIETFGGTISDPDMDTEIYLRRARGTQADPKPLQNGDEITEIYAQGYDGDDYPDTMHIGFDVDGTVSNGNVPTKFEIRKAGDIPLFTVRSSGNVGIENDSPISNLNVGIQGNGSRTYLQIDAETNATVIAGTCDDARRGRMMLDTTNGWLYICVGTVGGTNRGWDHIVIPSN
jgi:hypothetical protein